VPHPAEKMMNLRIQTTGEDAIDVLRRGLEDLEKICDITIDKFEEAYEKFKIEKLEETYEKSKPEHTSTNT